MPIVNDQPQADKSDLPPGSSIFISSKKKALSLGLLTFVILACLISILAWQRLVINKEAVQKETYDLLIAVKEKLQESLTQGISASKTLSFFIGRDGIVKSFDSIAAQILAVNNDIDILQLVPEGVVRYVYPLKGNEQVIGYDILKDSTRNKDAIKAIHSKQVFYAGPLELKQGGMAIIGRLPIFRNNKFWGFSAVIIRMPTLFKSAGIDTLGKSGYYFQLSKIDPETRKEEFFILHSKKFLSDNVVSVNMFNEDWKLSAVPVNAKKSDTNIVWLTVLGLLISLMGGAFIFTVAKRPEKLDQLVKKRTIALQESEERYRSLIEQASDGIIVYSFDGTIHQFNKRAFTESGYSREEFSKLNLKDLLIDKKLTMRQSKADDLQSGKTAILQRKMVRKDGSLADIEINVSMLPDTRLLAFVRNVTDRKNAENALIESERKFSRIFQSDLLGLAICDDQNRLIDMNECFASMMKLSRAGLPDITSKETSHSENLKSSAHLPDSVISILKKSGPKKNQELTMEKKDGKLRYLLISVEPLELNKQQTWLITAVDITEKKETELMLVQNEIKYRSLIEQASDGIIITDLTGVILEVNKSICLIGGYSSGEMIGRHAENFMPEEDINGLPLRINDLIEGKELLYERRMKKKDGSVINIEINSKMTLSRTLIGFIRDITERKKAAEALRKSNERFELIAKATNDAIWDHDFITNETVGNENLYNLYGYTPGKERIDFATFEARLHPNELEKAKANLQKALNEKAVSITEVFRFKTIDDIYKHFYDRAYIKYDDKGMPVRIVGVMQDITGRIEDEQRLKKEKELSDSIINSLPAVFYLFNKDGKLSRWNKNFETVTGYTHDEVSNLHPLDLIAAGEKSLVDEKIKNVFLSGKDKVEAGFLLKNGQTIPYYFSGMKIDYEGEPCLMGFGLDFSDKVKSDKLIKESEQKFRSLVEQASDGVAILSEKGIPLYLSPSVQRIFGYSESEIMKMDSFELTHPDDIVSSNEIFDKAIQNPGLPVKGYISRILHKDGSWRWVEDIFTNMLQVPAVNGIVVNFRDITEKLAIEKRITNEKELSDSIINGLPGIFYLYDYKGRFIRWNKNFETVTGYSATEIKQMHPLDFYDEDQRIEVAKRIQNVFTKNMPDTEFLLQTKSCQKIPFFYSSIAIEYEGIPCILGMAFNVTERKKIEQELVISNKQLERNANELKMSYSELERFAYIVSHDLQEPLRMVSSFLKLFEKKYKGQLDETGDKYIHFAVDGADRMKQLIMDLLEYSRTGTNREIPSDTDMNQVMAEVLNVFEIQVREQNARIEIGPMPVLPATSKTQMFQVMQNLISNALKFHSEKDPVIRINAIENKEEWMFSVEDNGIGIEPRFADKIFIIFQRLHNKDEFPGTGIGLSICKKIVEKYHGKIWVESKPGNGSTFFFSIPKK